jgi:hypothetical protein
VASRQSQRFAKKPHIKHLFQLALTRAFRDICAVDCPQKKNKKIL